MRTIPAILETLTRDASCARWIRSTFHAQANSGQMSTEAFGRLREATSALYGADTVNRVIDRMLTSPVNGIPATLILRTDGRVTMPHFMMLAVTTS